MFNNKVSGAQLLFRAARGLCTSRECDNVNINVGGKHRVYELYQV